MHEKEKFKLKKLIRQLESIRGRHTELITVYIPAGFNLYEMVSTLKNEQSTAENIKSKSVRKNVTSALEKIIRHLSLYKTTPPNGLAVFCGNIAEREGVADIQLWAFEPPEPLRTKLYWCSQQFDLEPLRQMIAEKEVYGIICLDRQEADIALVVGKKIKPMAHFESIVPGKTRAGGQSAMRFSRVREGLLQDWYKQVSEAANAIFSEQPELRGIIIGGPGPTKEAFLKSELLHAELRKKILGIIDTSYTGEYGVEETLARSEELIRETEIMKEKSLMQRFFEELQKPAGLVVYGLNETLTALKMGAIDQLLLSEGVPYKEVEWECGCGRTKEFLHENKITERKGLPCEKCGQPKQLVAETDAADALEELAKQFGTKFILVSVDTREGQQFAELGGIGGFLRYRV